jgi:hypothetical protein
MAAVSDDALARGALRRAGERVADLVAGIDDIDGPAKGLTWTVGETATHTLIGVRTYTEAVAGDVERATAFIPDAPGYRARMDAMTSQSLATEPRRDAATLSTLLREQVNAFLEAAGARSGDDTVQTPWFGDDATLPVSLVTRLQLGELLIHGLDIARGLHRPWPIRRAEALLIAPATIAMMPRVFDAEAARDVRALFRVRLRGGFTVGVRIENGTMDVTASGEWDERPDCTLLADPVAFLLLGYGRMSQWPLIAQGRLLAYGRKPWLSLRLKQLFVNP